MNIYVFILDIHNRVKERVTYTKKDIKNSSRKIEGPSDKFYIRYSSYNNQ